MATYDAIVIGGGPAGSVAALLLARAGWHVAVLEQAAFPRRKVCGEFLSAGTLALLAALDVNSAVSQAAGPAIRRVGVYCGSRIIESAMPARAGEGPAYGCAVPRETLDAALLEAAQRAGAALWQPCRALALRREAHGYVCETRGAGGAHALRGGCVIAAHGSWERGPLPTQGARAGGAAAGLLGLKARLRGAALPSDLMPLIAFPGGYGGMVHTGGRQVSFSCCVRRDMLQACRARFPGHSAGEAMLAYLRSVNRGVRNATAGAQREGEWLAVGPVRPGRRPQPEPGIYAVGNAAGEAHPVIAEGISMAIASAVLLAGVLSEAGPRHDPAAAAADYAAAWQHACGSRIRTSACYAGLAMRRCTAAPLAWAFSRFPVLVTLGARWSGKDRAGLAEAIARGVG